MAGTRTVYRGSHGRFAGASAGKAEKVKAGGFANSAFQQRFQAQRKMAPARTSSPKKTSGSNGARFRATAARDFRRGAKSVGRKGLKAGVTIGVTAGTAAIAANVVRGGGIKVSTTGMVSLRSSSSGKGFSVQGLLGSKRASGKPAGSILSQPNYAAAKGMKENLRVREVPLTMGSVNGVPVGSRAARPGR